MNGTSITLTGSELPAHMLAQAGMRPGDRASVMVTDAGVLVSPYGIEDWIAEGVGRTFSDSQFAAHLQRCPVDDDQR